MPRKGNAAHEDDNVEQPDARNADEEADVEAEGVEYGGTDGEAVASSDDRVTRLEAEAAEWKERCLRALADMDNVRRRSARDAEDAIGRANERFISDLLPVLDNFHRAIEAADQFSDVEALKSGVSQIHRQLADVVSRHGLERMESLGQPFDPNLHEAIMQVEAQEGQEPNQVVEELRAGYKLNDRVIRPPLVKVTSA